MHESHPTITMPGASPIVATGPTLVVREWRMPGPRYLHVHHSDDEAWHVLRGSLHFRFRDSAADAGAGSTVFVPAGVAHSYDASPDARYLIFLTPRLDQLIARLLAFDDPAQVPAVLAEFDSAIVDG